MLERQDGNLSMLRNEGKCMQSVRLGCLPSQQIHQQPLLPGAVPHLGKCFLFKPGKSQGGAPGGSYHIDKVQDEIELAELDGSIRRPPSSSSSLPRHTKQPLGTLHLRVCPRAIGQSSSTIPPLPSFPFLFPFPFPLRVAVWARSLSFLWIDSN